VLYHSWPRLKVFKNMFVNEVLPRKWKNNGSVPRYLICCDAMFSDFWLAGVKLTPNGLNVPKADKPVLGSIT
jgi:hypothetical protein